MQIFIQTPSGNIITVDVYPDISITDLKSMIALKENIPTSAQKLVFSGKVLEDFGTISQCGIWADDTIFLIYKPEVLSMEVIIIIPGGEKIFIEVDKTDTITQVKEKIAKKSLIDVKVAKLLYHGKLLDNGTTVGQVGIKPGELLAVIIAVRGC